MNEKRFFNSVLGDFKKLAEIVGVDKAVEISDTFGGLTIFIPALRKVHREERDAIIRAKYDRNIPVRQLSREYRLSNAQIYNILGAGDAKEEEQTKRTTI